MQRKVQSEQKGKPRINKNKRNHTIRQIAVQTEGKRRRVEKPSHSSVRVFAGPAQHEVRIQGQAPT